MSHCISVIITKIPLNKEPCYIAPNGFCIYHRSNEVLDKISQNEMNYVVATTDYFGGVGEQYAEYNGMTQPSINTALKLLGVIRVGDLDEFDTCGLGSFRNNNDLEEMFNRNVVTNKDEDKKSLLDLIEKIFDEHDSRKETLEQLKNKVIVTLFQEIK